MSSLDIRQCFAVLITITGIRSVALLFRLDVDLKRKGYSLNGY